jgi:hypothetical protein
MLYKDLNEAYTRWSTTHAGMDELLDLVRKSVTYRFQRIERNIDDIAQLVVIRMWRALMGDLEPYDPARGEFAKHVATMARSVRKDFYKNDRFLLLEEEVLEKVQLDLYLTEKEGQDPLAFERGEK